MRIVGWMGLAAVVGVGAWMAWSLFWPEYEEGQRTTQLAQDSILANPPTGYVPSGDRIDWDGGLGLYGERNGSDVTQAYSSDTPVPDGLNAWAASLGAQGWSVRTQSCPKPGELNIGSLTAYKDMRGFVARAELYVDDQKATLVLKSPDDGESDWRIGGSLPPVSAC